MFYSISNGLLTPYIGFIKKRTIYSWPGVMLPSDCRKQASCCKATHQDTIHREQTQFLCKIFEVQDLSCGNGQQNPKLAVCIDGEEEHDSSKILNMIDAWWLRKTFYHKTSFAIILIITRCYAMNIGMRISSQYVFNFYQNGVREKIKIIWKRRSVKE